MTTKRTSLFSFFLKTVMVVLGLALTAVLVLNGWSRFTFTRAQRSFETVATENPGISEACSRVQLRAAAKAASELNFEPNEKGEIGSLATLPLKEWTAQDDALVALVANRNRSVLESIALALVSDPPKNADPQAESNSDDRLDRSPIEIHLRLILTARMLAAEARSAIRAGHGEHAARCLVSIKQIAEGLECQGHFLDVLMGSAIEKILNSCLLEVVSSSWTTTNMDRKDVAALVPKADLMEALRSALNTEVASWVRNVDEATSDENLQGVLIAPIVGPSLKRLLQVAFLENGTRLLELIDTPFGSDPESFNSPPEPLPRWNVIRRVAWIVQPNMLNMIGRCQATTAQRQLLDAALTMRTTQWPGGAYPETRPDLPALIESDPFSGQQLEYQLLDDGQLHLAVADGPELLKALRMPGLQTWLDPIVLDAPAPE